MADSTLRLTFSQLQVRVADYLGIADRSGSALAVPTDAKDLELVKRLVNDGYRRFLTDNEKWNFLNVPLTINLKAQLEGTVTATNGTTTITVGGFAGTYANDFFNGFQFVIDEDTNDQSVYTVVDYTGATGLFTVATVASTVAIGDTLKIAGSRNVAGQAWRYFLPDDFYGLWRIPLTYAPTGPQVRINETTPDTILQMRAGNRTTGDPIYVAFRPINTDATADGKRWEALFWPEPNTEVPVTGLYKRFPALLSATTDTSVAGFQHDNTILACSLAAAELFRNDKIGIHEQMYQMKLMASKKLDARSTPRINRGYGDGSDMFFPIRTPDGNEPMTYNGTSVD